MTLQKIAETHQNARRRHRERETEDREKRGRETVSMMDKAASSTDGFVGLYGSLLYHHVLRPFFSFFLSHPTIKFLLKHDPKSTYFFL